LWFVVYNLCWRVTAPEQLSCNEWKSSNQ